MTPSARVQSAIELLDEIIGAARDGGAAADTIIQRYFKTRRYAGSKDRRAVRDHVYAAIRMCGEIPLSGRAAMLAVARDDAALAALFDGSAHGPAPIDAQEPRAMPGHAPRWMTRFFAEMIDASEIIAMLGRAPLDLRVNRLRSSVDAVQAHFPDAVALAGVPMALRLAEPIPVESHPAYLAGEFDIQDAGSQAIALYCAVQPGMNIIDLCAGGGGKTLALAADMDNQGHIIACDIARARMQALPDRATRAGATNIESRLLNPRKELAMLDDVVGRADLVLVDAPCSGTGTWRRNPESRWRLTPDRLDRLAAEQARLMDVAADLVRPGGSVVYAVCSLLDGEGAGQVAAFLVRNPGWHVAPDAAGATGGRALGRALGRAHGGGLLLTPHHDQCDGFFMARLQSPGR